eukprot:6178245-Pleurochrysis_carterae.AAC.1
MEEETRTAGGQDRGAYGIRNETLLRWWFAGRKGKSSSRRRQEFKLKKERVRVKEERVQGKERKCSSIQSIRLKAKH